jgi:hypothetical protein
MTLARFPQQGLCERCSPFILPRPASTPSATPERELSLANAMREFDAGNRDGRVREGLEASHRGAPPLDGAVVLLDDVVKIPVRAHLHIPPARMLTPQQPQRAVARHVTIERHLARHPWQRGRERLAKERLRRRDSAISSQQEVDRLPMLVDCAIQIVPLRLDLDVRLINPPRGADRLGESVPALLKFSNVPRYPAKDML